MITVAARAKNLRRHVLLMAEKVGQGYVGQGLGIADLLAVLYFKEMRYDGSMTLDLYGYPLPVNALPEAVISLRRASDYLNLSN